MATARPPKHDATVYVAVEATNGLEAELTACLIATCHPAVVMPVGSVVTDWPEN